MRISVIDERGVRVLSCAGELKLGGGDEELMSAVDHSVGSGSRWIVLDLTQVGWMDSAGVGAVVACGKSADRSGAVLKIVLSSAGPIRTVFTVTHLDRAFEIFDDLPSAIRSFPV